MSASKPERTIRSEQPTPNKLAFHAPELILEALTGPLSNNHEDYYIVQTYKEIPTEDTDRTGWLRMLSVAVQGYCAQNECSGDSLIRTVQKNLDGDGYKDWMTAWNTIRWIPGQAERMHHELTQYHRMFQSSESYPWMPAIIGYVIMLVRLDHPEYKQHPTIVTDLLK